MSRLTKAKASGPADKTKPDEHSERARDPRATKVVQPTANEVATPAGAAPNPRKRRKRFVL
jgi:hypothetical protein